MTFLQRCQTGQSQNRARARLERDGPDFFVRKRKNPSYDLLQ
jgi:hypothetical protein